MMASERRLQDLLFARASGRVFDMKHKGNKERRFFVSNMA